MATATHHPPPASHGHKDAQKRPEPIDPERDIDARATTKWVLISAVFFFVSFYLMLVVFDRVLTKERFDKIDNLPNSELQQLRDAENAFLRGEESKSKKSIEQVMQEMLQATPKKPDPPKKQEAPK